MKKLTIAINASKSDVAGSQLTFSLFPSDVAKIKKQLGFIPTNLININYDQHINWDFYLDQHKQHVENIFSLGSDKIKFKWNINY